MYVNITIGKASGAQIAGFAASLHETFQFSDVIFMQLFSPPTILSLQLHQIDTF